MSRLVSGRRGFLKQAATMGAYLACGGIGKTLGASSPGTAPRFKLSLAEWSLRHRLRSGAMTNLDFPRIASEEFGLRAVEYVSTFFEEHHRSPTYLAELNRRAEDAGVRNVLIMVDLDSPAGDLASRSNSVRRTAAINHQPWIDAAAQLGCHAIRVNARGHDAAEYDQSLEHFVDGLRRVVDSATEVGINVLVENHGGLSSNGRWLARVMQSVAHPRCGTLPDFGNFVIDTQEGRFYDPLVGLAELMPYAKGVSAKAHQFDSDGRETTIDYPRMMRIVRTSSFSGHIGIEWGGRFSTQSPEAGIMATKALLERLISEPTDDFVAILPET